MSLTNYRIDPSSGICVQLANPDNPKYASWKPCRSEDIGKKITQAVQEILPEGGIKTAELSKKQQDELAAQKAAEDKKKKMTKRLIIAGSVGAGLVVVALAVWMIWKARAKPAPVAAPAVAV